MKRTSLTIGLVLVGLLVAMLGFASGGNEQAGAKAEFTMKGEPISEPKLPVGEDVAGAGKYTG